MKKLATHHAASCSACETHETRYVVHLSVVITLTGKPACHDTRALFENAAALIDAAAAGGDNGDAFIDRVEVDGISGDDWRTESRPAAGEEATS